MSYDPQGPVAKQLTPLLVNELTSTFNIPDDAQDTADYINMLIGQNRTAGEICAEVKEVVSIPIDETFMGRVFQEIGRLQLLQQQQAHTQAEYTPPQQQEQQIEAQQPLQPPQQPPVQPPQAQIPVATNVFPQPLQVNPFQPAQPAQHVQHAQPVVGVPSPFTAPTGPAVPQFPTGPQGIKHEKRDTHVNFSKLATDFKRNGGIGKGARPAGKSSGVGKDYVSNGKTQKKSFGMQNAANLQKVLAMAPQDSVNMQHNTPRPPKGRCPDFPHCKNRECTLAHPTKKCFAYPNCPNGPGTCDYLHPSEDGELMRELEKTKQEFYDRKALKFAPPQVTLCKYGILCSKELCPFGHPTPANKDAKVIIPKWCRENKNCQNEHCEYAHSSPNYQAPARVAAPPVQKFNAKPAYNKYAMQRTPTSLEQCKFGLNCTNQGCTKRHATSAVACRAGYNCTRMDCTFHHQIDEDCRFGNECKNSNCYYRHPDGREKARFQQSGAPQTIERPFAVAEDQVMEQATQI